MSVQGDTRNSQNSCGSNEGLMLSEVSWGCWRSRLLLPFLLALDGLSGQAEGSKGPGIKDQIILDKW